MKTLHVSIADKIASYRKRDGDIVCGNSDYQIKFDFDDEWDDYTEKTAIFKWNGKHKEVTFTGTTCAVPMIIDATSVAVGVFIEDVIATTEAKITARPSALCQKGIALTPGTDNTPDIPDTPRPDTPVPDTNTTTHTVYYGSTVKTLDLTKDSNIKGLGGSGRQKSFSAIFAKGYNRFVVAFSSADASSLTVTDETPIFGGDITSEFKELGTVSINKITYKVYAYTVATNDSDADLSIVLR